VSVLIENQWRRSDESEREDTTEQAVSFHHVHTHIQDILYSKVFVKSKLNCLCESPLKHI